MKPASSACMMAPDDTYTDSYRPKKGNPASSGCQSNHHPPLSHRRYSRIRLFPAYRLLSAFPVSEQHRHRCQSPDPAASCLSRDSGLSDPAFVKTVIRDYPDISPLTGEPGARVKILVEFYYLLKY